MNLRDRLGRLERKLGPPPGLVSAQARALRIVFGDVRHVRAPRHPDGRLVTPREEYAALADARGPLAEHARVILEPFLDVDDEAWRASNEGPDPGPESFDGGWVRLVR
jgi:hypothetical protein